MSTKMHIRVKVTRHFDATAERVFDAWLDPKTAGKWMFATPTGQMVRADIEPREGGAFCMVDRRDGKDVTHLGEYLEIDRPRRLVFMFSVDGSESSRVIVDIVPLAAGCDVTLTNEIPPAWAEYADRSEEGWRTMLDALAATLGKQ